MEVLAGWVPPEGSEGESVQAAPLAAGDLVASLPRGPLPSPLTLLSVSVSVFIQISPSPPTTAFVF